MKVLEPYQDKAADFLASRPKGVVKVPAGGGKTLIAVTALDRLIRRQLPSLPLKIGWIAPTEETRDQALKAAFEFPMLREQDFRASCVYPGLDMSDRDILIVDECHHATAPMWMLIIQQVKNRWGLSATPKVDDPDRNEALKILFGEIFEVERHEVKNRLVGAKVIMLDASDPDIGERIDNAMRPAALRRIRFTKQPQHRTRYKTTSLSRIAKNLQRLAAKKTVLEKEGKTNSIRYRLFKIDTFLAELSHRARIIGECTWQAIASIGIAENRARTDAAVQTAIRHHGNDQVLILVGQVEHGEEIAKRLGVGAKLVHSKLGKKQRATALQAVRDGTCRVLIATSLADEGLDLPMLNVLILVSGGRSNIKTEQRTGRVLRAFAGKEQGTIYDFLDQGHPTMANQSKARVRLYKSLGYHVEANV